MKPRSVLPFLILSLLPLLTPGQCGTGTPAFPLKVSENGRYPTSGQSEEADGSPFPDTGEREFAPPEKNAAG